MLVYRDRKVFTVFHVHFWHKTQEVSHLLASECQILLLFAHLLDTWCLLEVKWFQMAIWYSMFIMIFPWWPMMMDRNYFENVFAGWNLLCKIVMVFFSFFGHVIKFKYFNILSQYTVPPTSFAIVNIDTLWQTGDRCIIIMKEQKRNSSHPLYVQYMVFIGLILYFR